MGEDKRRINWDGSQRNRLLEFVEGTGYELLLDQAVVDE